jgi:hypothetical protein
MSTDQRPQHTPTPSGGSAEPAKPKLDLSLTQVLGGALAAMTAAFLGSRLSVTGTVIGAAVASVVAAVAGSVYTASLRTTRERVRMVWQGRVAGSDVPATVEETGNRDPGSPAGAPAQPSGSAPVRASRPSRLSWRSVVATTFAAFGLAALLLTGVELATGSALSGGDGTTISQVTEPERSTTPQQDATPSASPSSASPSATATPTPSAAPSETTAPTPSPSASTPQPTTEPTPTVSPTPDTSSSASATPQG